MKQVKWNVLLLCHALVFLPGISRAESQAQIPQRALNDFQITYDVEVSGFAAGTAIWKVEPIDEFTNRFHVKLSTKGVIGFFYPVDTSSETHWEYTENGRVRPLRYEYIHSRRKNRHLKVDFDWQASKANVIFRGEERQELLTENTYDIQIFLLELGIRAAAGEQSIRFETIGNKRRRTRIAQVVGESILQTDSGSMATLQLYYEDGKKKTTIWYSKDHQLLPVMIEYLDKGGERVLLHATSITMNGNPTIKLTLRVPDDENAGYADEE